MSHKTGISLTNYVYESRTRYMSNEVCLRTLRQDTDRKQDNETFTPNNTCLQTCTLDVAASSEIHTYIHNYTPKRTHTRTHTRTLADTHTHTHAHTMCVCVFVWHMSHPRVKSCTDTTWTFIWLFFEIWLFFAEINLEIHLHISILSAPDALQHTATYCNILQHAATHIYTSRSCLPLTMPSPSPLEIKLQPSKKVGQWNVSSLILLSMTVSTCVCAFLWHMSHPRVKCCTDTTWMCTSPNVYDHFHSKCHNLETLEIHKLKFLGTNANWTRISIWICTVRYQEIWVSRCGGFRGCCIFSWHCHISSIIGLCIPSRIWVYDMSV